MGGSLGLIANCLAPCSMLQAPSIMALPADAIGSWAFLAWKYVNEVNKFMHVYLAYMQHWLLGLSSFEVCK